MATDSGVLRFLAYARGDRPRTADWRTMQQAFIREEITLDCLHHLTAEDLDDLVPLSCRAAYDAALRNVKRPRNARFRGLTRAMVVFRRMRLRAAQAVYAPGGAGFAAAAASFNAAAAGMGN